MNKKSFESQNFEKKMYLVIVLSALLSSFLWQFFYPEKNYVSEILFKFIACSASLIFFSLILRTDNEFCGGYRAISLIGSSTLFFYLFFVLIYSLFALPIDLHQFFKIYVEFMFNGIVQKHFNILFFVLVLPNIFLYIGLHFLSKISSKSVK